MSSTLVIPFNFRPSSTQKGTGTYTCPAGKYALVTISVSGSAYVTATSTGHGTPDPGTAVSDSESFNQTMQIWVGTGDQVSASLSNASATDSVIGPNQTDNVTAQTTATINHNGSPIAQFRARGTISVSNEDNTNSLLLTISVLGASSFHFYAQEYNVVT